MKGAISFFWETAKVVALALLIVLPIRAFVFQPFLVRGASMEPNFHHGDYLVIDELSYRFRAPERGEVIVLKFPGDTSQRYIKRIVGLPGETVEIAEGNVQVVSGGEDTVLKESYLPLDLQTPGQVNIALSAGEYFVLGDNRPFSSDSRSWGVLPKDLIVGRAFLRLFPPHALAAY